MNNKDILQKYLVKKMHKSLADFEKLSEAAQEQILLNEYRILVPVDDISGEKSTTLFMNRTWFDKRQKYKIFMGKPNGRVLTTIAFKSGYNGGGKFNIAGKNYEIMKRNEDEYALQTSGYKYDDVATIDPSVFALIRSRSKMYVHDKEYILQRNAFNIGSIVSVYDSDRKLIGQIGWGNIISLYWKSTIANKLPIEVQVFMLSMYLGLDERYEESQFNDKQN
jgi:hypothetical protein